MSSLLSVISLTREGGGSSDSSSRRGVGGDEEDIMGGWLTMMDSPKDGTLFASRLAVINKISAQCVMSTDLLKYAEVSFESRKS